MPTVPEIVTESVIKQLEQGVAPWRKPWSTSIGEKSSLVTFWKIDELVQRKSDAEVCEYLMNVVNFCATSETGRSH